jgi:hypothetical protein
VTAEINKICLIYDIGYGRANFISGRDNAERGSSPIEDDVAVIARLRVGLLEPKGVGGRIGVIVGEVSRGEICESYERTIRRFKGIPLLRAIRERISVILFPGVINLYLDGSACRPEVTTTYRVDRRWIAGATCLNSYNRLG